MPLSAGYLAPLHLVMLDKAGWRLCKSKFTLDQNGFQIFDLPTTFKHWHDRKAVQSSYMKESAEVLRKNLDGVDWIYFYSWRLRDSQTGEMDQKRKVDLNSPTDALNPAMYPHIGQHKLKVVLIYWAMADNTHTGESDVGSVLRAKHYLKDNADDLLRGRLRAINMWRPIETIEDYPLALAESNSFTKANLVASDNIRSNFQGETFFGMYTPDYRTLHAAFKFKSPHPDAKPRRSIELRALVFSNPPGLGNLSFLPNSQLLYGTAWKDERTTEFTLKAIEHGYRAIDTACQPRSYREDLVEKAIQMAFTCGILKRREDIWIQSKFTTPGGHDVDAALYDLATSISEQVHTSVALSLTNLAHRETLDPLTDVGVYIDSVLFHSSYPQFKDTLVAWETLSTYVPHKIRSIGVSNMPLHILRQLYTVADIKPATVQNRFMAENKYDIPLRRFCHTRGISFQAFSILKDKLDLLGSVLIEKVAASIVPGISKGFALHLLVLGLGSYMRVVNGATTEEHLEENSRGLARFKVWPVCEMIRLD
ncbi:uncharacterized protein RAG0_16585 [Rhynchosporium agropyri]|uniref:NADP-dependent oxidoreductase domain-containing protein n=1 Tax=Rhynchosporium agropyri TaxID=914238 RepID=A0A1E1LR47_9HELO|nr:uncharacterized protein RAG0_16585 [Rhynchosporium agropyri]